MAATPNGTGSSTGERSFVGRTAELAAIRAVVEAAVSGRAGAVFIEGEAGSGKTALLRRAVAELPAGFVTLWAEAEELASDMALSLAGQLGALQSSEAFPAGLELLAHIARAEDSGPVAVLVDDLHWADRSSRRAVLTAVRRLGDDRVVVIVTSRPDPTGGDGWERLVSDPDRCLAIRLGALNAVEVAELARRNGVALSRHQAERLHRHTEGHPLYVRMLLHELDRTRLATDDQELPAPRSLASTTIAELAGLSEESRVLAAALAVLNRRVPLALAGRVAGLDEPTLALEGLLATELCTWHPREADTPVELAHPLYRAAIYDDLSPTTRQRLHRAAAEVLEGRRAMAHEVAAADGPNDALAEEIEHSSRGSLESGARSVAATQLLWASSLSSGSKDAERRLLEAARLLLADGQVARAATLRSRVEACADGPLRSLVLGRLAWAQGDSSEAQRRGAEAIAFDPATSRASDVAVALATVAALYATFGQAEEALEMAGQALQLAPSDPEVDTYGWIALAVGEAMARGSPAGLRRLAERLPEPPEAVPAADTELLSIRGTLGYYAGRVTAAIADVRAVASRNHDVATGGLPRAHMHLSQLLFYSGDWDQAVVQAHVALSLTAAERWTWINVPAHATLASVLAARGEWERAEAHVAAAQEEAAAVVNAEAAIGARVAAAGLEQARDRPDQVVAALVPLTDPSSEPPMLAGLWWWPSLVVAMIECGELEGATAQLERLEEAAGRRGLNLRARIEGLRARLNAARGQPGEASACYERAVSLLGADDPLLDRALLHHAFGRFLVARGRRSPALEQLAAAHDLFAGVGAEPFRARVAADLSACGKRAAAPAPRSALALTEREQDVAALVSRGMTNREVAAELYVSEKAVEYHLRNVFGKLGLKSRGELRRRFVATA